MGLKWLEEWGREYPDDLHLWVGEVGEVMAGWPPKEWGVKASAGMERMKEGVLQRVREEVEEWEERRVGVDPTPDLSPAFHPLSLPLSPPLPLSPHPPLSTRTRR